MKQLLIATGFLFFCFSSQAQLGGVINNAKKKAEQKVNEKVNDEIDKQVDGDKNDDPAPDQKSSEQQQSGSAGSNSSPKQEEAPLKVYSKYDFVPGNMIVAFEDFSQDAVGDFPMKWNTNASGEVVTIEGKPGHWLMLTQKGYFLPEFIDSFADNFTLEFDMMCDQLVNSWGLTSSIVQLPERNRPEEWQSAPNLFTLNILPGGEGNGSCSYDRRKNNTGEAATSAQISTFKDAGKPVHVALWRQKERMRVYLNEQKVWDVPKAFLPDVKYNSLVYAVQLIDGNNHFLLSNIRLAVGAPDTRSKLITEGKWVTHGILFDVNSANIKPESYGTLKQLADVLKENADVKVKIVGYTDSDGDEAKNLDLSKRRAASVKEALSKEFGIDTNRMETDGKGEADPIDTNKTPEGKANNRRVEFVKL